MVYVVNGAKKWITNGMWSDYCTAAVRTGEAGRNGISALIIPMKAKGSDMAENRKLRRTRQW